MPFIISSQNTKHSNYFCFMEITNELVDKLANLSKLNFDVQEKEAIKNDLSSMIGFIEQLQKVDTTGIQPLLHMSHSKNILREDILNGSVTRENALLNAPNTDGQYFKVPKVIKK